MGYITNQMVDGERLVARGRLHWVFEFWGLFWTSFFALVALFSNSLLDLLAVQVEPDQFQWLKDADFRDWTRYILGGMAGLSLLLWVRNLFDRWMTEIGVTTRRLIYKRGFLNRSIIEISLRQMETVEIDQGLWGRILSYGQIIIRGTGSGDVRLPKELSNPFGFRKAIAAARADYLDRIGN